MTATAGSCTARLWRARRRYDVANPGGHPADEPQDDCRPSRSRGGAAPRIAHGAPSAQRRSGEAEAGDHHGPGGRFGYHRDLRQLLDGDKPRGQGIDASERVQAGIERRIKRRRPRAASRTRGSVQTAATAATGVLAVLTAPSIGAVSAVCAVEAAKPCTSDKNAQGLSGNQIEVADDESSWSTESTGKARASSAPDAALPLMQPPDGKILRQYLETVVYVMIACAAWRPCPSLAGCGLSRQRVLVFRLQEPRCQRRGATEWRRSPMRT